MKSRSAGFAFMMMLLYGCMAAEPAKTKGHTHANDLKNLSVEQAAITETVLDYVEGWYSSNGHRMEKALSKHLVKRRILPDEQISAVSKSWMVKATANGMGQIPYPDQGRKEITILAQTDSIASVMLVSEDFVDYLHLVKIGESWKIANALWDYLPK